MSSAKRSALAALALLSPVMAMAADLPLPGLPPAPPPPVFAGFDWSGIYVGVQGGYAWGRDNTKEYVTATWTFVGLANRFNPEGYVLGVHVGGNWQFGSFVVGVEGDIEHAGLKGGFVDPPVAPFNPGGRANTVIDVQGSLRARFGYAIGNALIYGTAGIAGADMEATYFNWGGVGETFKKTVWGYTVGAGLEYAFTNNLTARVEYRFTEFNLARNDSLVAFPGFSGTQRPIYNTGRVGVSYKF